MTNKINKNNNHKLITLWMIINPVKVMKMFKILMEKNLILPKKWTLYTIEFLIKIMN